MTQTLYAKTRTALAALSTLSLPAGALAVLEESGRQGLFQWNSSNHSAVVKADPNQCLTVAPASDTAGSSGAWTRVVRAPLDPAWCGAAGDHAVTNDTAALQAAIDLFKNPDTSLLPHVMGFESRYFKGRAIDLKGRIYGVSDTLNYDTAHGLELYNGTIIAIGTWRASKAIFEGDNAIAVTFHNLTLEGNGKANGILANRNVYGAFTDINIWGIGTLEYGFKSVTNFGGLLMKLTRVNVYGTIAAKTAATTGLTATAFLLIGGSDSTMIDCEANRVLAGADIAGGGWRVIGNHFTGSGDASITNDIGLKLRSGQYNQIIGNNFDNAIMWLQGNARRHISGNMFRSDTTKKLTSAITWEATAASQTLGAGQIVDNFVNLTGVATDYRFIDLKEAGGNFFSNVDRLIVERNLIQNHRGALINPTATAGTITISAASADFTSTTTVVDLSKYILLSTATPAPFRAIIHGVKTSDGTVQTPTVWSYNNSTSKLSITFAEAFTGFITIDFKWGVHDSVLTSQAPNR